MSDYPQTVQLMETINCELKRKTAYKGIEDLQIAGPNSNFKKQTVCTCWRKAHLIAEVCSGRCSNMSLYAIVNRFPSVNAQTVSLSDYPISCRLPFLLQQVRGHYHSVTVCPNFLKCIGLS